jgi:hypothetical protein
MIAVATPMLREDYWETFQIQNQDVELIYNFLLESETPLTTQELMVALVKERIRREKLIIEQQRSSAGSIYLPKENYPVGQKLVFPALGWRHGQVAGLRAGQNPDLGKFSVLMVKFEDAETKEFAAGIEDHILNNPIEIADEDPALDLQVVLNDYGENLAVNLENNLASNPDFVRIAGKWFPRALLVDINVGHLNLAEAVLDMAGGGPLPTSALLQEVGLAGEPNVKLVEFSLDLALQEDLRFDEVGPAGEVMWYLHRLEPEEVLQIPPFLRYQEPDYDRGILTPEMIELERRLDDELSPIETRQPKLNEVQIPLIFPHWRAGTLPLSSKIRHLIPTAYEAPRIRFMLVDGDSGEKFPGWVVRQNRYVYGLRQWYDERGLMPGSQIWVRRGKIPGEVIIQVNSQRPTREWIRTVLVGSDGGVVFAMLKQVVTTSYDERMSIAIPDVDALDLVWQQGRKERTPFERIIVNVVRELAKLNPQSHVHASELYAAVNVIRRCPPGPILALLASRPWFIHVGDLHFRFDDSERA